MEHVEQVEQVVEQQGQSEQPNREAARYRTQLRATEAERDVALGALAAMRRAEVVRLAGEGLARGDELFQFLGDDLTPYLSEDGTVDAEKVAEAAAGLVQERPHLRKHKWGNINQGTPYPHFGDGRGLNSPPPSRDMGAIFRKK